MLEGEGAAVLARQTNVYLASLRDTNPSRYGFFAAMPTLTDTAAALAEIAYAFDELRADGVTLLTRCGARTHVPGPRGHRARVAGPERERGRRVRPPDPRGRYHLGRWRRAAAHRRLSSRNYPRGGVSLIVADTPKVHAPNCKVILSHAGGTLPYLANRVAVLPEVTDVLDKTRDDILAEIAWFYYDVPLSSAEETIRLLLHYTTPDHLLYGTDYPYAPAKVVTRFAEMLDRADLTDEAHKGIDGENSLWLFLRSRKE
jgi:predicted TIM-barrel fold metal-dependent hydrolase